MQEEEQEDDSAKFPEGQIDLMLNCSGGESESFGDLLVAHAVQTAHPEYSFSALREPFDGQFHQQLDFLGIERVEGSAFGEQSIKGFRAEVPSV